MSTEAIVIPEGRPKSGRIWKPKQKARFSSIKRAGLLKNQSKTFEERQVERIQKAKVLGLERDMREESKQKRAADIERILEKRKRIAEGEKKNAVYQQINATKLKNMNKKQLRMVRKTSVNKDGVVELVSPWDTKIKAIRKDRRAKK